MRNTFVAVYQMLDEVLAEDNLPPGAKATIHGIIDDLNKVSATRDLVVQIEWISVNCTTSDGQRLAVTRQWHRRHLASSNRSPAPGSAIASCDWTEDLIADLRNQDRIKWSLRHEARGRFLDSEGNREEAPYVLISSMASKAWNIAKSDVRSGWEAHIRGIQRWV